MIDAFAHPDAVYAAHKARSHVGMLAEMLRTGLLVPISDQVARLARAGIKAMDEALDEVLGPPSLGDSFARDASQRPLPDRLEELERQLAAAWAPPVVADAAGDIDGVLACDEAA